MVSFVSKQLMHAACSYKNYEQNQAAETTGPCADCSLNNVAQCGARRHGKPAIKQMGFFGGTDACVDSHSSLDSEDGRRLRCQDDQERLEDEGGTFAEANELREKADRGKLCHLASAAPA